MGDPFKIFAVDDDPIVLEVIRDIAEPDCAVETFGSAEACLARLDEKKPDMFLLDVGLPGMDGYALCRRIKGDPGLCQIPVTFVSGHDTIDARLKGYDAGGEDFIVKPFEPEEVLHKIKVAQHILQNQRTLQEQAEASDYLSSLALASMDEGGIVLQFMSKLIGWSSDQEIAEGLLELMQRYRLDGVVQTRTAQRSLTLSKTGTNLPLETSVIDHVREMGRIFEFRARSVHNFDHVTLMVNNMPLSDQEFCGRIRDNLSVAAQGADSRLQAIETEQGVLTVLQSVREAIGTLREAHIRDRAASSELMLELDRDLANSFIYLGMSDKQERQMENLVGTFSKRLVHLLDRGDEVEQTMQALVDQLGQLQR